MRIVRLDIHHFRSIHRATLYPDTHNVLLGPNNVGKTAVLEALNLLLNPELGTRSDAVDENDFYRREYLGTKSKNENGVEEVQPPPHIIVEAVLTDLTQDERDEFGSVILPWDSATRCVVEMADDGSDPFAGKDVAIRVRFDAWFDELEDEFVAKSHFVTDTQLGPDESIQFHRQHKRIIGFLIYRDFRALQRPITLERNALFARLLSSQDASPRNFEHILERLRGSVGVLFDDENFARVVAEYRQELLRYMPLSNDGAASLQFEATDRTRDQLKEAAQLYVASDVSLPVQKMGAGTRSLAILAMLLLIARKRGRGIIALEEPETFLFPHAQRRVADEVMSVASQTFITTHSPHVLERLPASGFLRLRRASNGDVTASPVVQDAKHAKNLRERFRKHLSEALLGVGAIVVEEESTRLWLLRASALVHGQEYDGAKRAALELLGIAIVSSEGNGDVPFIATILSRSGLAVAGFLDQCKDEVANKLIADLSLPVMFHRYAGLEDLLVAELPLQVLKTLLTSAPGARHSYSEAEVEGWDLAEFKKKAREFLRQHKGYLPIHEWVHDQLDLESMPKSLVRLVCVVGESLLLQDCTPTCTVLPW